MPILYIESSEDNQGSSTNLSCSHHPFIQQFYAPDQHAHTPGFPRKGRPFYTAFFSKHKYNLFVNMHTMLYAPALHPAYVHQDASSTTVVQGDLDATSVSSMCKWSACVLA